MTTLGEEMQQEKEFQIRHEAEEKAMLESQLKMLEEQRVTVEAQVSDRMTTLGEKFMAKLNVLEQKGDKATEENGQLVTGIKSMVTHLHAMTDQQQEEFVQQVSTTKKILQQ